MFFLTYSNVWSFSYFFIMSYTLFIMSVLVYIIPIISNSTNSVNRSSFYFINSYDLMPVLITPMLVLLINNLLWTSPAFSSWFGHIVWTSFQLKMSLFIIFTFVLVTLIFTSTNYFTSREVYDYILTKYSFLYWIVLLYTANTIFTTIFIIEVLSALIFLLIITSTFSSTFFYRNLDFSFGHLFQQSTPYTYLQAVLYFFWVSLISSLNLFLFTLFFYTKILTFDWYIMEYVFIYFTQANSLKDIYSLGITWFILMFCLFLKCGIAPLYVWKPTFFKGIPLYTLFFYVCFFYFFLFLFIIHLLTSYFTEVFYFYSLVTFLFLFIGLFMLLFIICESYYLKAFLAISSILNSLFVILALSTTHSVDLVFWM